MVMRIRFIAIFVVFLFAALSLGGVASAENKTFPKYDEDAAVIKRLPPIMPNEADGSGYCCMTFDINRTGTPINIEARYCTEGHFEQPSKEAISKWSYSPAKNSGKTVIRRGVQTTMSFHLRGVFGQPVEGHTGYLATRDIGTLEPPKSNAPSDYRKWLDKNFRTETPCGSFIS